MSSADIILLVASLVAAINHFYTGFAGYLGPNTRREQGAYFLAFTWCGSWYAFWVGLLGTGLLDNNPELRGTSQLLSGYITPALYLFTCSMTSSRPLSRRLTLFVLVWGLPGTIFSVYNYLRPESSNELWQLYVEGRMYQGGPIAWLYFLHTAQLLVFFILSAHRAVRVVATRKFSGPQKHAGQVILLAVFVGLLALFASNIFPHIFPTLRTIRFGPAATIPAVIILYYSLLSTRHRFRESEDRRRRERARARRALLASQRRARQFHNRFIYEKERIALEVHDSVGARMTELIMEMEAHKDGPLSGNVRVRLREILEQLREVVSLLQQETDIILEEEMREYLDRLVSTGRFDLDAVISGVNAQPEQRFHLHRIFLELMTNVVRHSGARKIKIRLRRNRYGIQLSIADNGAGIPKDYTPGNGLRNIQRRARRLNARLRIHSRERHGTVASVLVRERSPSVFA